MQTMSVVLQAESPNGRFTEGASAINKAGGELLRIEIHGKNLFYFFGKRGADESTQVVVRIHFGMAGEFAAYTGSPPAPKPATRLRLTEWSSLSWLRRAFRRLYESPAPRFSVDGTDRGAAQIVFDEGQGVLLTDGTRACMAKDHILYDQQIDADGTRGMMLVMDNQGVECGHDAQIAVGHLAAWEGYGFGDFEWVGRVHHSPDGGKPPANSFCCFSTFVHGSLTHNEIAWCFPPNDGTEVHMAYWYDDTMHRVARVKSEWMYPGCTGTLGRCPVCPTSRLPPRTVATGYTPCGVNVLAVLSAGLAQFQRAHDTDYSTYSVCIVRPLFALDQQIGLPAR